MLRSESTIKDGQLMLKEKQGAAQLDGLRSCSKGNLQCCTLLYPALHRVHLHCSVEVKRN